MDQFRELKFLEQAFLFLLYVGMYAHAERMEDRCRHFDLAIGHE